VNLNSLAGTKVFCSWLILKRIDMAWLKHTYATQLPQSLFSLQAPEPISNPKMVLFNEALAHDLGVAEHLQDEQNTLAYLAGNEAAPESQPLSLIHI